MRNSRFAIALFLVGFALTSIFAPADSGLPSPSFFADLGAQAGPQVSRGPYLQMGTSSSVVVRWRTPTATDSEVHYGPDPANLSFSSSLTALTTNHEVALSALQPATKYYYSVGSTSQPLAGGDLNHFFVTSPLTGTASPTRIWVLGDSGTADANAAAVRDGYYAFAGSTAPNLWLMLGDNAYNAGTDSEYQAAVFDMFPATLRQSVLWPTIGNHDIANTAQQTGPYYDIFTLPKNGQAGGLASGTEAYYSFDYANVHFICLDSFDVDLSAGSPMMTWLQNDIASTTARWIIAFWHHPAYSKGSHDSDIEYELVQMRQNAVPILEAGGVDLVLSGHSHSYERSFLVDGHYGSSNTFTASMKVDGGSGREDGTGAYNKPGSGSQSRAGAVYTVAGSSGFAGGGTLNHPAMFISMNVLGSLVLDVNDGRLDLKFVDNNSVVRDYFTIVKGTVAPLAITTASLPNGGVGVAYQQTLAATGGVQPYTWSLVTGTLPSNLTLDAATGQISGLPTVSGTSDFTVRVSDSGSPSTGVERTLSISIASEAIVPNVVNLTQAAATAAITGAGLTVGAVAGAAHASVPIGSVISQDPAAGSPAPIGTPVHLLVSSGVTVPQTVGLTESAATALISGTAGLSIGTITTASSGTVAAGLVISQNPAGNTNVSGGTSVNLVVSSGPPPFTTPVAIGTQAAGTFGDASGHSGQSHLFYAENAGVWWLLTLTSSADSPGGTNHLVKAYVSSGPDLATATWTAAANSPGAATAQSANCSNCFMGGGRSLGVAYINNAPTDAVHAEIAMAFDGQNGITAHIRATVTATAIQWSTWSYYDEPSATWTLPRGVSLGVSTGKYIHSGGPTLQQQVDANVRVSIQPDTGASWTNAFSGVSLIDNSMSHQSNSMIFAALAANRMLSVYDNGGGQAPCYLCESGVPEPNLSNLGYRRSNVNGSWPTLPPGGQAGGDGQVFSTDATINHNDWTLVARDTTTIHAFRRSGAGTGIDAAAYDAATNTWAAFPPPPLFEAGQSHKAGSGVFGIAANAGIWLFVISNDSANSILYTTYEGAAWSAWAAVPGTAAGQHVRNFISGSRVSGSDQIGLIWMEGTTQYDVVTTSIRLASTVPNVVNLTQAAATTSITAAGLAVGTVTTASSSTVAAGSVISQNPAAGTPVPAGSAVDLVIALATVPDVVNLTQAAAATTLANAGLTLGTVEAAPNATVPIGSVISQNPPALSEVAAGTSIDLVVSTGITVPNVVGQTQAAASTTILNVAGLSVGMITTALSDSVAAGLVISQNPAGQTSVSGGSSIDLVVSSGPPIVPNVVGLTQAAATAAITGAQLVVGSITSETSETVPAGLVISQNPVAGVSAPLNSAVDLVISLGPAPTPVPDAVNMTQAAATDAITAAGLIVGIVTDASSATVPAGSVISQNPVAGTLVASGTAVDLVISTGPPPVLVPNVVSLTQAAATSALTSATLVVGIVTNASSVTIPAGSVISQNPVAATPVASGSAVDLVVSTGPPPVLVPNVVGLTQAAATAAITGAQLVVGSITSEASETVPAGLVISQNPVAGVSAPLNSAVDLVISLGPAPTPVPDAVNMTQAAATDAITAAGLIVGIVTDASSATVPAGSVISQNPVAGTLVASGTAVDLVISTGPPPVLVPNVVSLTQAAATSALTSATLVVGIVTNASSATVPAGSVISQNPAAATPVVSGSAVDLVVSTGPPPVLVPNVVNLTQAAATSTLTGAGLIVGTLSTASSATVPAGLVISQDPVSGTEVAFGSAVNLVVSTGPPPTPVPDVVNMTQADATTAILEAGLVVGTVTNSSSASVPAGSVISQTPSGGSLVPPGSAVNLVVSTGPPPVNPIVVDKVVFSDGKSTRTTPQFSTSDPNELLLAFVASDGPTSGGQTVRVTGAGLTWTLVRRANAQLGTSEVWRASATAQLTNVTVRSIQTFTGYRQSLTVVTFRNASGVGASAIASGATGAPSVTLTTTAPNSLVYGVGNDWDRAVARTLGPGQTMVHQWVATAVGDTFWVQRWNVMVPSVGTSIQLNCTAPVNDQWNFVSVELIP